MSPRTPNPLIAALDEAAGHFTEQCAFLNEAFPNRPVDPRDVLVGVYNRLRARIDRGDPTMGAAVIAGAFTRKGLRRSYVDAVRARNRRNRRFVLAADVGRDDE